MNVNFHSMNDTDLPSELVTDADNADALRRQLILPAHPALPVAPPPDMSDPQPPPDANAPLPDP